MVDRSTASARYHSRSHRLLAALCALFAVMAMTLSLAPPRAAADSSTLPCDPFANGGAPCVAAYSSVRAMYGSYNRRSRSVGRHRVVGGRRELDSHAGVGAVI